MTRTKKKKNNFCEWYQKKVNKMYGLEGNYLER